MPPFLPRYPLRPHHFLPALLFSLDCTVRADESAMPMVSVSASKLADRRYDAVGYQNGIVTVVSPSREAGLRLRWSR
ncbi:hypothetical protein [Janthinobacterium sp. MDB2-8]|uniref:hypothetical protein n=1 Tax=Janthinobacterium sp. MDB2-8 TaxID=1259338 RepID=UPI003F218551